MLSTHKLLFALTCAVLTAGSAHASARDLQAVDVIGNDEVLYDPAVVGTDPLFKLSFDDPRLRRTASGFEPEQVCNRHRNIGLCRNPAFKNLQTRHHRNDCIDGDNVA